jgi:uncharacterized membrane protein YfcA
VLDVRAVLLVALAVLAVGFGIVVARAANGARPGPLLLGIGFLTDFLDTLGIGSFAPTTALFRLRQLVPDRVIPGTLNAGHAIPSIVQALVFIAIVDVEPITLLAMLLAAVAGGWLGAGMVARWPRRRIQGGIGVALLVAAAFMLATNLGWLPGGGDALGLHGTRLVVATVVNGMLGALMTLGIGLYAPCMILVSLLGMSPLAAFPIMMGSCAMLMPFAGARFIAAGAWDVRATVGLTVGGIPGVLVAAFVVRSLPLTAVRWLVVCVVVHTAVGLLRAVRAVDAQRSGDALRSPSSLQARRPQDPSPRS